MKANNQAEGWIAGYFPSIELEEGDRFASTIGCLDHKNDCSIRFSLEIETADGEIHALASWTENYDDVSQDIEVDLSEFAGLESSLILKLEENGGRSLDAIGYWLNARILR
jgi:hypothetical protein